ncbi:Peroxisomal sarcosine oxidase [Holothuria leucospilota]|uniref:Peroxisomal sarcosine oxidase n=1 Tax=Holothuria leucospilota TaxID=206669 RepID=A0A9Q1HCM3_HOLLE|nr:Peroxisomal sarcosine oxidase [Holothuria leucospilota]
MASSYQHNYYDYIVVGCGGVGSAALFRLARNSRGNESVLGIEQFHLGHDNGGSQDHSRIIRLSYAGSDFIALADGAYKAWAEVEDESGIQLVQRTGGLDIAEKNTQGEARLKACAETMDAAGIKYEFLHGIQLHQKFPSFSPKANTVALYQKDGGLVDAALSNAVHIQLARKYGADVLENTVVRNISRAPDGKLCVSTSNGTFRCKKVVVTAGAWLNKVLKSVGVHIPVTVTQEQVTYFGTPHMKEFTYKRTLRFPYFINHTARVYAIPIYGNSGFKIGMDAAGPSVTPDTRTFVPDEKRVKYCVDVLKDLLPRSLGPILYTKTCLYTMTSDRIFVVDTAYRTGFPDVAICCGAGHVYKFAAVMGKILSQITLDQRVSYNLNEFTLDRPAITDPNFKKNFVFVDNIISKTKNSSAVGAKAKL